MFKTMLGFITGVILLYFSGVLINSRNESLNYYVYVQIALTSLGLFLIFIGRIYKRHQIKGWALYILALSFGFAYASISAERIHSARIPSSFDQQIVQVTVFLCGLPRQGKYSFSADFCLLNVQANDRLLLANEGLKARLRWPLDEDISERIVLMGAVKNKIASPEIDTLHFLDRVAYEYHQFRKNVSQKTNKLLDRTSHKGVIKALLLGDRSKLSPEEAKVLANTGTQHLIAISGLHVGLVMLGIFYLLPRSLFSILLVSVLGFLYVLLVGFSPSAQRAWVMCVCALFYLSGYIKQSKWKIFFLALFLILVLDPLATLNLGFWYSFLYVAIIFLIFQLTSFDPKRWLSLVILQLLLMMAMVPLSSILGAKHGLENVLANTFAIPWISLLILPLALFWLMVSVISDVFAFYFLSVLDKSIELLTAYLASLKVFNVPMSIEVNFGVLVCFFIGFMVWLVFNKLKGLSVLYVLVLVLVIVFPGRFYEDKPELIVFDVGQGLALAIKSEGRIWLYDIGPAFEKSSSLKNIILPYLRQHRKSNQLTGIIVSHGDADHAGDLGSLYDEFRPEIEWSGQPERLEVNGFDSCMAGMKWQQADFLIEVLYPYPGQNVSKSSSNNHSCVVRIRLMGKIFLMMGDLEAEAEMDLVKHYRGELKADVLIAGHHGASKSSSFALLKHVQAEYVVFSAGYLNKFAHPSDQVLQRISKFNTLSFNTSSSGAIKFNDSFSGENLMLTHARQ